MVDELQPSAGAPQDIAGALVSALTADAELVDHGTFRLDVGRAREKLAAYQLESPARLLLLLVEAGHLLRGCTAIEIDLDRDRARVELVGVALTDAELRGWFDAAFIARGPLDEPDARHLHGRQRLALALNAALGQTEARISLRSSVAGQGVWRATLDRQGKVELDAESSDADRSSLRIELEDCRLAGAAELLDEHAAHAELPIHRDGAQVLAIPPRAELVAAVELVDDDRRVGLAGWSPRRHAERHGVIAMVANGVLVEALGRPELPPGYLAVVDASELERDLSQGRLVRDAAFERHVELAAQARDRLAGPAPVQIPIPGYAKAIALMLVSLVFMLLLIGFGAWLSAKTPMGFVLSAGGLLMLGLGVYGLGKQLGARREALALARDGQLGIAVIGRGSGTKRGFGIMREYELELRVERPGGEPERITARLLHDQGLIPVLSSLRAGTRVFVRFDPGRRDRVGFIL